MKFYKGAAKSLFAVAAVIAANLHAGFAQAQEVRDVSKYNITSGVGLKGNDPVSYFPEGERQTIGAQPSIEHRGVTYNFKGQQNVETFLANPEKYEPTYGGWCAFAMASGSQVDIDPSIFTINGNRIHFFVSRRAKQLFDADVQGFEVRADRFWKQISGEEPRK
ncbi:MAG: hypothetical protein RLZZ488_1667 [Pseudomonadota bacterium]|jgi:YHS domain-containing protein